MARALNFPGLLAPEKNVSTYPSTQHLWIQFFSCGHWNISEIMWRTLARMWHMVYIIYDSHYIDWELIRGSDSVLVGVLVAVIDIMYDLGLINSSLMLLGTKTLPQRSSSCHASFSVPEHLPLSPWCAFGILWRKSRHSKWAEGIDQARFCFPWTNICTSRLA